jgi:hypothetical protein
MRRRSRMKLRALLPSCFLLLLFFSEIDSFYWKIREAFKKSCEWWYNSISDTNLESYDLQWIIYYTIKKKISCRLKMKIITIRTKCIILMEERDRILTRQMRLGHSYGMFASFGNDEFCTRRRGGCFQIPHLILSPSSKESSMSRQQQLQIKTGKTKLKRICGCTHAGMSGKCSVSGLSVYRWCVHPLCRKLEIIGHHGNL